MGDEPTIELDVNDFNDESPVAESTTTPEPSTEETNETEVEETEEAQTEEEAPKEEGQQDEADEPEGEDTEDDQPKRGADARKEQLQTEIRQLVSQRNELRAEVERATVQAYRPQTAEELIDQGVDPVEARVTAMEQRTAMAEYTAHVTDLNANLNVESLQVMSDFPIFNPEAPDYNADLANRAKAVYEKAAGLQTDPKTGMIVSANVLPYEIYKAFAETHAASAQTGQVSAQRAAEKMLSNTDTPPVAAPPQPKEDPFLTGLSKGLS